MKTGIAIAAAVGFGAVIAFWLFGLAFNLSARQFHQAALVPILVAFVGTIVLVAVHPASMKWSAIGIMGPTVVLNGFFFVAVLSEGRGADWSHLTTMLEVVATVTIGAICGRAIGRLIQLKRAG